MDSPWPWRVGVASGAWTALMRVFKHFLSFESLISSTSWIVRISSVPFQKAVEAFSPALSVKFFQTIYVFKYYCLGLHMYLFFFFNKFIYFWLCWVFVSVQGLSPVAASGGHSSSRCAGLSLLRPLPLRSTGSRRAGSVVVAHGPSCSAACRIFPDRGMNPCPLHWQADS